MTQTAGEKLGRRLRWSRERRLAVEDRYIQMLLSRLERKGIGTPDIIRAAMNRDMQRAVCRFNKENNEDGHYD